MGSVGKRLRPHREVQAHMRRQRRRMFGERFASGLRKHRKVS